MTRLQLARLSNVKNVTMNRTLNFHIKFTRAKTDFKSKLEIFAQYPSQFIAI